MRCRFGFRVLAIAMPAMLGLTSSLPATTIYDDFDSASLDTGLWSVQNYGGSVSQASSEVTVGGAAFYEIDSTSEWGPGKVFQITIGSTAPTGMSAIGTYGTGAGTPGFAVRNDTGSWQFDVQTGATHGRYAVAAPAANDVLEFVWNSDYSVDYRLNGSLVVTDTTVLPTGVVHFIVANWGGQGRNTAIGSVAIAAIPEPTTLILMVSGAFGLLCYAWRRRK